MKKISQNDLVISVSKGIETLKIKLDVRTITEEKIDLAWKLVKEFVDGNSTTKTKELLTEQMEGADDIDYNYEGYYADEEGTSIFP